MAQRLRSRARRDPDLDEDGSPPSRQPRRGGGDEEEDDELGNEDLSLEIVARAQRKRRGASGGGVPGFADLLTVSSGDEEVDEDAVVELAEADEPRRMQKKKQRRKQRKRHRKEATEAAVAAAVEEEEKEVSLRLKHSPPPSSYSFSMGVQVLCSIQNSEGSVIIAKQSLPSAYSPSSVGIVFNSTVKFVVQCL